MSDLNNVSITGRLIKDPELKYTPSGKAVTKMCISLQGFGKDEKGYTNSELYDLTAWGTKSEYAGKYLVKGNHIGVEGRLETQHWVDKATGTSRKAVSISVKDITNLSPRANSNESGEEAAEEVPAATTAAADEPINDPFSDEA